MTNTLNKIIHNGDEYELPGWFSPDNAWTTDDVLTKTANGYEWTTPSWGVKVFDFPAVNDDITDLITWLNSWWDAILKESNSYCRVTSYDGINREIHTLQESTNARDDWAILYNSSNIVTSVSSIENKYFTPGNAWTTDQVLTKTASWYEWAAPSGWDVMVSSQSWNILTSWMKIWAWTESDYSNLGSYDNNTVYLTI